MSSVAPSFSVVVPVFNKAAYLERSINSVLTQSFADFELLLIDDASTDGSLPAIKKFSDSRIRLLRREVPGPGGYAARNLGIAQSRAAWVAFLDADDEWCPRHLAILHELMVESHAGVVAAGWFWDYGDDALRRNAFSVCHAMSAKMRLGFAAFLKEAANGRMPMWTGAVAVKRDLLLDVGGFPEDCRKGGDTVAWIKLVKTAGELTVSTQATAVYHRVDSFVTATVPPEAKGNCVRNLCQALLEEVSEDKRVCRLLKRVSNFHVGHALRRRAREGSLRFSDCGEHYFAVDWLDHILFRVHGLLPRSVQLGMRKGLSTLKRAWRSWSSSR